ncbi:unnamed protein product [Lactuca virosa]|uniref:tRNA-5-taurinomethyluridine 2-sulfurtransferase n=1 Tax=Lactuca virosa TaxID=75947 RepID=A0AAU9PX40_9ASTR|nr:unnamed protein product [Lactuca virosa]
MYVENRTLRIPETEMSWRRKMLATGTSRCERSIIGVWCKNDMKMTLHATVPQISNATTFDLDNSYLSCSMTNSKRPFKITVLLSGGVDNSVALRLLHASGHSCTAFYLKIWFKASYLIDEYKYGCTPNPDVLCNTRFKFGAFMDAISNMDFEFVASGHYAKVIHPLTDETNELSFLQLSKDMEEVRRLPGNLICLTKKEGIHREYAFLGSLCTAHQVLKQWAKSGGLSYNDYVELCAKKEAVSELGKEAKLDMFELPAKIKLLPDPWTPESGLVTAALKLKREQLKAKSKDDLQKLYEWLI